MHYTKRSNRRSMLITWFSVFTILVSVFAYLPPASAQDGTPEAPPAAPAEQQITTQDTSNQTITVQQTDPIIIESVTIACPQDSAIVSGTLNVQNPQDGVIVEVRLIQSGAAVGTHQEIQLFAGTFTYPFEFNLSAALEGSVHFAAVEKDLPGATESFSPDVPIYLNDGGTMVCGTKPPATNTPIPTATNTPIPTNTPVPTATATNTPVPTNTQVPTSTATTAPGTTPTATATATSTPTNTPSPTPTNTPTNTPTPTTTPEPTITYATVVGTGGMGLRCRTAPVSGSIITVSAEGSRIDVRGATQNGWVPVKCAGRDGWMSGTYLRLTTTGPTPTPAPGTGTGIATVVNTSGAGLRCRTAPISGGILTVVPEGSKVELRGAVSNGWAPVKCAGRDAWMSAQYLRIDTAPTNPTPTPGSGTTTYGTVVNTGSDSLRCRTSAVTGATITLLPPGMRVEVRGAAVNNWYPVRCAGRDGWVSGQYFRVESSSTTPTPTPSTTPTSTPAAPGTKTYGTVVNTGSDSLRCRTSAVTGATITLLPPNTRVEVRGAAVNGWHPVRCSDRDGWVSGQYFRVDGTSGGTAPTPTPTAPAPSGPSTGLMVSGTGGSGLRCRTAPVSGATIVVLPEGTFLKTRGSASGGWYPVTCSGQNGWVSASYVVPMNSSGGSGEVWMDVDLGSQYMRVYRGNTVIMETYVSTGRPGFDTPTGTYYVNTKLTSQTMSGVLGGEYYYVPNVPWVMYFTNRGHAIHGAYWHNNFGYVMSHGCINLPVGFAKALYQITPIGARVRIHW